jgi:hypothetical protein
MLSSDVCNAVLASCKLVSPPLKGILRRCYPYANLTDLSFLENPSGYVAGVTNPMFADKTDWWDVLCDIETGRCSGGAVLPNFHKNHKNLITSPTRRRGGSSVIKDNQNSTINTNNSSSITRSGGLEKKSSRIEMKKGGSNSFNSMLVTSEHSDSTLQYVREESIPSNNHEAVERHCLCVARVVDAVDAGTGNERWCHIQFERHGKYH